MNSKYGEPLFTIPTMVNVAQMRRVFGFLWGQLPEVDGTPMLEILNVSFIADDDHIFGAVNEDYVRRELEWYQSQSLSVNDFPGGAPKIWEQVASTKGLINSNYGYLLLSDENGRQYDNVVKKLKEDRFSRQAVAVYTRPTIHDDWNVDGMSDFICTNTVQYVIRENMLHVNVSMRSNDAVFGYRNDYAWQRHVQNELCREFGTKPGFMTWNVGSLHVYPRHYYLVEKFQNAGIHDSVVTRD